jgi:hypothetical protein
MRRLGWCLAIACVVLAASTGAAAEPTPAEIETARKLFAEAEVDQKAERWEHALATLQKVAAIKETPGVRFHIGNCLEHLARLTEALESFQKAQALAESKPAREVLDLAGPRIEQLKARVPTLKIRATGRVTILLDGKPLDPGLIGVTVPCDPGKHTVTAEFQASPAVVREVSLREGQSETMDFTRPASPSSAPPAAALPVPGAPRRAPVADAGRVPVGAWLLMGAGVGLGVGGYFAFRHAGSVADDSREACARSIACDPARGDVVHRYDALALALWSGAAVSLGAGIVWAVTPRASPPAAMAVALHPNRIVLQGAF